jgi:hypothetical protein
VRLFLDNLAALKMFLTGEFPNAKSVYRARTDFRKMKKHFHDKRKENLKHSVCECIPEIYIKSLVCSFYFKKKDTFSKLNEIKKGC